MHARTKHREKFVARDRINHGSRRAGRKVSFKSFAHALYKLDVKFEGLKLDTFVKVIEREEDLGRFFLLRSLIIC